VILADENIVAAVIARLRTDGWDVAWIAEVSPSIEDVDVLAFAAREHRILLTDDKDFGELVVRDGRTHRGVVLLRLAGMPVAERADLISRIFAASSKELRDVFTVVNRDGRLRAHKIGEPVGDP
jgi:predicted nuclease of predicted toxin-antitoxin system